MPPPLPQATLVSTEMNAGKLKLRQSSIFRSVADSDVISSRAISAVRLSWDEMLFRIQIPWFPFMKSTLVPPSNWTLYTKQDRKLMFPRSNSYLDIDWGSRGVIVQLCVLFVFQN